MSTRSPIAEEISPLPARSGTPAAWKTLALLGVTILLWIFFEPLLCGTLGAALRTAAWFHGDRLVIGELTRQKDGSFRARDIEWFFGPSDRRSSCKSEWMTVRPTQLWLFLNPPKNQPRRLMRDVQAGKARILVDRRSSKGGTSGGISSEPSGNAPLSLLPDSITGGPVDLVVIGDSYRLSFNGLQVRLPARWSGRITYAEAAMEVGTWHRAFRKGSADATWDGAVLQISGLMLDDSMRIEELSLAPRDGRMEFGIRGLVGGGLLRGDGAIGDRGNQNHLEVTMVGERLNLRSLSEIVKDSDKRGSGIIRQARLTYRGDSSKPLGAESSLLLLADNVRWEGRGWESLRLSATLTGRNLTVTELSLRQKQNEVVAQGSSRLPENWREALKAPFNATFTANLEDAGSLAALVGPGFAGLSGSLFLDGAVKGAENRAEGYCNIRSDGLKVRALPLDWLQAYVIFEGSKTRLGSLEAWSGGDRMVLEGSAEHGSPHAYKASAQVSVKNLTMRLGQLGITTAPAIGSGGIKGAWQGQGSALTHAGSFQAQVSDWVSRWTSAGVSGTFQGGYSPGTLRFDQAEFRQGDLMMSLRLQATPDRLEASSITARRNGARKPLVEGAFTLPLSSSALWETGRILPHLHMTEPLSVGLSLHAIKAEEIADLLGQQIPFGGVLDGEIKASGTPELPEIHGAMTISGFAPRGGSGVMDLGLSLDAAQGTAEGKVVRAPATGSPLEIQGRFPFRWIRDKENEIRSADVSAPVTAKAIFHHVPLDGWTGMVGVPAWPLRKVTLDGTVEISGTIGKPSVSGTLSLDAGEGLLPSGLSVTSLHLPWTLGGGKATLQGGRASVMSRSATLSGTVDWAARPWNGNMEFAVLDLPMPILAGLVMPTDVALTIALNGESVPMLRGSLTVYGTNGLTSSTLMPFFCPPGVTIPSPAPVATTEFFGNTGLDLTVKTGKPGDVESTAGTADKSPKSPDCEVDLRLKGTVAAPIPSGTILFRNQSLQLPSGSFEVPFARVECRPEGTMLFSPAYGLTSRGFAALEITGSPDTPATRLRGAPGVSAPDLLLALASCGSQPGSQPPLSQCTAWARQAALFPLPAVPWMTVPSAKPQAAALGFEPAAWAFEPEFLRAVPPATNQTLPKR